MAIIDTKFSLTEIPAQTRALYQRWVVQWGNPEWKKALLIILGGVVLSPLVGQLPMLGHDWFRWFYTGVLNMYPPWMVPFFEPFRWFPWRGGLAILNSISLVAIAAITFWQADNKRSGSLGVLLALFSPLPFYLIWLGQLDGLILVGLLVLPISMPLVLFRVQIFGWLLATRRNWFLVMMGWLLLSFLIWGFWVPESVALSDGSVTHPTAMGWATLGWPVLVLGLVMLAFSTKNIWRFLAASFLAAPYVQPYHLVILLPVLGRVSGLKRWLLWGFVWVVGMVPGFVGWSRYAALGFAFAVWWLLRDEEQTSLIPKNLKEDGQYPADATESS